MSWPGALNSGASRRNLLNDAVVISADIPLRNGVLSWIDGRGLASSVVNGADGRIPGRRVNIAGDPLW